MTKFKGALNFALLAGATLVVCLFLGIIIFDIFSKGLPSLSWDFMFSFPKNGMTSGGILPAVIGTLLLTMITTVFAVPFGISCAVYLNEYAPPSLLTGIIRLPSEILQEFLPLFTGCLACALLQASMGTSVYLRTYLGLLSLPYHHHYRRSIEKST
jgi:phosphate transport system permease protein